ncbi:MAG: IclR family transcriptional regulator [candidate division WS1 bacterium]|nr:IclR family transcriptional regulator [candidate division WS1 bacterium]
MIRALERACDLLEILSHSSEPLGLSQLAAAANLHSATCANLLKTLMARGYVDQVAPRKGYQLGPMAYYLARQGPWRKDLVRVATPFMSGLARLTEESVVLATLHQGRWYQLAEVRGDQPVQANQVSGGLSVYRTATGRVLLAYLPEEAYVVLARHGMPGEAWPEVGTNVDALAEAGRLIREAGGLVEYGTQDGVARVAFPVWEQEQVVAALGVYLPDFRFEGEHEKLVIAGAMEAAKEIEKALDPEREREDWDEFVRGGKK